MGVYFVDNIVNTNQSVSPKYFKLMVDKLYFFSRSAEKEPGKGKNEKVANPELYKDLPIGFRQVLSNLYTASQPFEYKGRHYRSIEHVFQGEKMRLAGGAKGEAAAYKFTVESGDPIGAGEGKIAQSKRKLIKLNKEQLAEWDRIKDRVMEGAALALYKSDANARRVLLATGDAQLWHIQGRKEPSTVRFVHLERIRDHLRSGAAGSSNASSSSMNAPKSPLKKKVTFSESVLRKERAKKQAERAKKNMSIQTDPVTTNIAAPPKRKGRLIRNDKLAEMRQKQAAEAEEARKALEAAEPKRRGRLIRNDKLAEMKKKQAAEAEEARKAAQAKNVAPKKRPGAPSHGMAMMKVSIKGVPGLEASRATFKTAESATLKDIKEMIKKTVKTPVEVKGLEALVKLKVKRTK